MMLLIIRLTQERLLNSKTNLKLISQMLKAIWLSNTLVENSFIQKKVISQMENTQSELSKIKLVLFSIRRWLRLDA